MPTTLPGVSVARARELLRQQDGDPQVVPEVERVWGKAGRANTATDPAGLDMFETTISLKPESEWRPGHDVRALIAADGLRGADARRDERVDDADQGTHRHARHRHPDAGGHQDLRARPRASWSGSARRSRRTVQMVPGTRSVFAERAVSGLLPGHRHRSRGGGAARAERRRRAGCDRHGDRRDDDHADRRGARALRRARALPAGAARHAGAPGDGARSR